MKTFSLWTIRAMVAMICGVSLLWGQNSFQWSSRPVSFGARAAALADAYTAEVYDVSSMYWNPASLVFLERNTISVNSMMQDNSQATHTSFAVPLHFEGGLSASLGLTGSYFMRDIRFKRVFGSSWDSPYFTNHGLDLGFATRLSTTVSAGVLFNVRYASISTLSLWASTAMIGLLYYPMPGVSYGITYQTFGPGIVYQAQGKRESLDYEQQLPQSLKIGTTFRFPGNTNNPTANIMLSSELLFGEEKLRNRAGIEIWPWRQLALRIGFTAIDSATVLRAGFGVTTQNLQFGYAYCPVSLQERYHQISFGILIGRLF